MNSKATIARIMWEKAHNELSRADTAYQLARKKCDEAWSVYRDTAIADGWCPFCKPAVLLSQCKGHVFFADNRQST